MFFITIIIAIIAIIVGKNWANETFGIKSDIGFAILIIGIMYIFIGGISKTVNHFEAIETEVYIETLRESYEQVKDKPEDIQTATLKLEIIETNAGIRKKQMYLDTPWRIFMNVPVVERLKPIEL